MAIPRSGAGRLWEEKTKRANNNYLILRKVGKVWNPWATWFLLVVPRFPISRNQGTQPKGERKALKATRGPKIGNVFTTN